MKSRYAPPPFHPCSAPGCPEPGDYKAPKSRYETGEYQYLCLEHIREFNRAWDYFDGWDREQIERFTYEAALGHRPTWKISSQPVFTSDVLRDRFFEMLGEKPPSSAHRRESRVPRKEREALAVMGLEPGAGLAEIKSHYKKLVKKHHPDVNRGDKASEETFKRITAAYHILLKAESFS
jgi:DnaJ-domain-containing protein 1